MNNGKTGYYICFKSDHLREMLGSYSFSVGATRCPKLTVDYHGEGRKEGGRKVGWLCHKGTTREQRIKSKNKIRNFKEDSAHFII